MTTYGVISTGFLKKPIDVIEEEIQDGHKENISPTLNLLASGVMGQAIGIIAAAIAEGWDVAEEVYASGYPDSSSEAALDGVMAITGATRLEAEPSTVTLDRLNLEDGTTIQSGSVVGVGSLGNRFETTADVSNSLGYTATFSVAAESVNDGEIQGLAGTIDTIHSPTTGWSAASALSPSNAEPYALSNGQTLTVKVDGGSTQTATFETADFVSIGAATAAEVAAVIDSDITGASCSDQGGYPRIENDSEDSGNSIQVTGGTANTALGFSTSLIQGFNSLDADLGREEETDAEARLRREQLLRLAGAGTVESLLSHIADLDDVTSVYVFTNRTLVTDGDGLPGKSFEVVVLDGDDTDIAEAIWTYKPAGIEPYGSSSEVVVDSQGFNQTMYWSRPSELTMYIDITVQVDSTYPSTGDDLVKAALVAYGDALTTGDDVVVLSMASAVLEKNDGVTGAIDVTVFKVDIVNPPVNTANYTVGSREIAVFDTARITVTTV